MNDSQRSVYYNINNTCDQSVKTLGSTAFDKVKPLLLIKGLIFHKNHYTPVMSIISIVML